MLTLISELTGKDSYPTYCGSVQLRLYSCNRLWTTTRELHYVVRPVLVISKMLDFFVVASSPISCTAIQMLLLTAEGGDDGAGREEWKRPF